MHNLHQEIAELESVCDGKDALVSYYLPQLSKIVETIQLLPRGEQEEFFGKLERISMILEGQMMALSEELEELRKKIPAAQVNRMAARAYNSTIVSIPMGPKTKPTSAE